MNKLRILLLSCCLLFTLFTIPAKAQVVLDSCYAYSLVDGFEGAAAAQWSPWNASQTGTIRLGMTGSARTGSSAALFSYNRREPIGSGMLIDKTFNVLSATTRTRFPRNGCLNVVPWPPAGQLKHCAASVWVSAAAAGASGALQLIDTASWTYLTSKSFSFVGATGWTKITTDLTSLGTCKRDVTVRIVLARDTATSEAMAVDDVQVNWYYL